MSKFKLKTDDWPVSESKLKSARDTNTIKDKFSLFMQRKETRNSKEFKEIKDFYAKRSSQVSNKSCDISFDKSSSPHKMPVRLSTTKKDIVRNSTILKTKPMFSLFEENLRGPKLSLSALKQSRNTITMERSPFSSRSFKRNNINNNSNNCKEEDPVYLPQVEKFLKEFFLKSQNLDQVIVATQMEFTQISQNLFSQLNEETELTSKL